MPREAKQEAKTFPLPELFWHEDQDGPPPDMPEPMAWIYVKRVSVKGEEDIATSSTEQLNHRDQIRDLYGPGTYKLVGRSLRGSILARAKLTIGTAEATAAPAATATAAAGPPPGYPSVDPMVASLIQSNTTLAAALAKSGQEANSTILSAITQLAGARLTDQKELFHTLLKAKGAAGGSGGELPAFLKGTEWIMELYDKANAGEDASNADTGTPDLKTALELLKEFRAMRGKANDGQPPTGTT